VEPESRRFSLFHNGFISNYKELLRELKTEKQMTDTEIIATLVDQQLSQPG
jgi:glucosamine 6-phosphate synthetase-like amidotransferase/phosphosugar isomerase protein